MKQCKQCYKEFEAKTSAAEFCSGACRAQTARIRAQMSELPADVQNSIEKMCSENNNGDRAASHSRQAMTERALDYQAKMGNRPGKGMHVRTDKPSWLTPAKPGDVDYNWDESAVPKDNPAYGLTCHGVVVTVGIAEPTGAR